MFFLLQADFVMKSAQEMQTVKSIEAFCLLQLNLHASLDSITITRLMWSQKTYEMRCKQSYLIGGGGMEWKDLPNLPRLFLEYTEAPLQNETTIPINAFLHFDGSLVFWTLLVKCDT